MPDDTSIPRPVALLGYGGLIPFAASAIGAWLPVHWAPLAAFVFMGYSAAILAFLGGLQWGIALEPGSDRCTERLTVGVLPALVAAVALPLGVRSGSILLLVAFLLLLGWEFGRNRAAMPAWYMRLRLHLTAGVALFHLVLLARYAMQ